MIAQQLPSPTYAVAMSLYQIIKLVGCYDSETEIWAMHPSLLSLTRYAHAWSPLGFIRRGSGPLTASWEIAIYPTVSKTAHLLITVPYQCSYALNTHAQTHVHTYTHDWSRGQGTATDSPSTVAPPCGQRVMKLFDMSHSCSASTPGNKLIGQC